MGRRALQALLGALFAAAAAAAGANEPIAPNELGLTAIDCATQYCTEKDSLLLWLSLENVCFADKQPYFSSSSSSSSSSTATSLAAVDRAVAAADLWTLNVVGAVCMTVAAVGLAVGYAAGGRAAAKRQR